MILRWKLPFFLMLFVGCPFVVMAGVTIKDIKVSIQAKSGIEARDLALKEARQKAYQQLASSEQGRQYHLAETPIPSADALESAVDTFQVENEKISSQRYVATFAITFSQTGLLNLAQSSPSPATALKPVNNTTPLPPQQNFTAQTSFVLIPIYITSDETLLWQPVNPLRSYLNASQTQQNLKGIIPLGDVEDMAEVTIEDIMAGKHQKVRRLIERYQKDLALVLLLRQLDYEGQSHELTVKVFDKDSQQRIFEAIQIDADDQQASFKLAVENTLQMLAQPGAVAAVTEQAAPTLMAFPAQVSFDSFSQWQQIKAALNNPIIQAFDIAALSRKHAKVVLHSQASIQDLTKALAQARIDFQEASPGLYEIKVIQETALAAQEPLQGPRQSPFAPKQESQ
jgi:Uncharacterized protein conserved in bacteria (DUF2066).